MYQIHFVMFADRSFKFRWKPYIQLKNPRNRLIKKKIFYIPMNIVYVCILQICKENFEQHIYSHLLLSQISSRLFFTGWLKYVFNSICCWSRLNFSNIAKNSSFFYNCCTHPLRNIYSFLFCFTVAIHSLMRRQNVIFCGLIYS